MTVEIPTLAWFLPLLIASCVGWYLLTWRYIFGPIDRAIQRRIRAKYEARAAALPVREEKE